MRPENAVEQSYPARGRLEQPMRIVVSTPTGNIGKVVADRLIEGGAEVVVIHRIPEKVEGLAARGATVLQGSLDDEAFLAPALEGAAALFWVTPPDHQAENFRASQNAFGAAAAAAVQASGVARVVNVSSIGAQHDEGTGPVAGLHDVEEMLDATDASVLHLRAGYFFENYSVQVDAIQAMGGIMLPVSGTTRLPMIATRDIGNAAADILLDESSTRSGILGLHGPADLSFDEAAEAISAAVDRDIPHMTIDDMQARMGLSMLGIGQSATDTLIEWYHSIESGHLGVAEPRTEETTTPMTMEEWAAAVMAPFLA